MALIKCIECGGQVSDNAQNCPNCGYPIEKKNSGANDGYICIDTKDTKEGATQTNKVISEQEKKQLIITILVVLVIVLCVYSCNKSEKYADNNASDVNDTAQIGLNNDSKVAESEPKETEGTKKEKKEITKKKVKKLSKTEYKKQCKTYSYNDIFFSNTNLEGKYIKIELFVEESMMYDNVAFDLSTQEYLKEKNVQRTFFRCGVYRKKEKTYVGGKLDLYFPKGSAIDSGITTGNHLTVWGEVINHDTTSGDMYHGIGVKARYVNNKK